MSVQPRAPYLRRWALILALDARHDAARELLGEAPLPVDAAGEHQFLEALALELLIRSISSSAVPTRHVARIRSASISSASPDAGACSGIRGCGGAGARAGLLHERAVALPDGPKEGRGIDASLAHLVVEIVDACHDVRADGVEHPRGVGGLAGVEERDIGERAVLEAVDRPARAGKPRDARGRAPRPRARRAVDLYNQGKTYREIAEEARMSPRDIGVIVNKAVREEELKTDHRNDKENQDTNNSAEKKLKDQELSLSTRAYKLFSKGKALVEVAVALNLLESRGNQIL